MFLPQRIVTPIKWTIFSLVSEILVRTAPPVLGFRKTAPTKQRGIYYLALQLNLSKKRRKRSRL